MTDKGVIQVVGGFVALRPFACVCLRIILAEPLACDVHLKPRIPARVILGLPVLAPDARVRRYANMRQRLSSSRLSRGSSQRHTASIAKVLFCAQLLDLASKPRGTLYIGVTNGLPTRVEQHRSGEGSAFTRKEFGDVREAIQREKTLKHYVRAWKINLIERTNPHWIDLYPTLPGVAPIPLVPRGELDPRNKSEDDC